MIKILIVVLLLVFVYFIVLNDMVFKDRSVYFYKEPYTTQNFPKIIHQTWKTKNLDENQKKWQKTILDTYPDYEYKLWDDEDIENFVKNEFAWYYDTWKKLNPFIKKIDTVRYMWMYKFGGIYFDLDMIVYKRMDHLLDDKPGSAFIPTCHSIPYWFRDWDCASPAVLASYPGNSIWIDMLKQVEKDIDRPVLYCTGPRGLSNLLREIHKRKPENKTNLVFLSEPRLGVGLKLLAKYSMHINTGTWS